MAERTCGAVRRWAAERLAEHGAQSVAEDAKVVLTELVTNAWRAGADRVAVLVVPDAEAGLVRLSVHDDAPGLPHRRDPGPWDAQGRGLIMVEALAVRWGHRPLAPEAGRAGERTGREVWAELAWRRHGA